MQIDLFTIQHMYYRTYPEVQHSPDTPFVIHYLSAILVIWVELHKHWNTA